MASLSNKLKVATIGLTLLVLTALPLNAQGKSEERKYFRKANMENCLSKSGRSYPHLKNEKVEIYCRSKKARRDNFTVYIEESPYESYCVSSQAKRYNRHFEKISKSRR